MRRTRPLFPAGVGMLAVLSVWNLGGCLGTGTPGTGSIFNLPPVVVLTSDLTRGIAPLTVQFNSGSSTDDGLIVDRRWDFGDGQTSREISPSHVFNAPGEYTVALTLTDDVGATTTRTRIISVTLAPVARINVDKTSALSAPAVFNFDGSQSTDPDGQIESFAWNFGDGSGETDAVVPHTYGRAGTYRVTLTVTDNTGVTGSAEVILEVGILKPSLSFRVPPPDVTNIVASNASPLWVYAVFNAEAGVPRTIRAGVDLDQDQCDANATVFSASSGAQSQMLVGHGSPVTSIAFSPDGTQLVTGSTDRTARVFDIETGLTLLTLGGHAEAIRAVAWAENGNVIITAGDEAKAIVHDASTGADLASVDTHAAVTSVAVSQDGARFVTGGDFLNVQGSPVEDQPLAQLWNTSDGTSISEFRGHGAKVTSVAISLDGQRIVTGSVDLSARLWDADSGLELIQFQGHTNTVTSVAYFASDAGNRVLTGSSDLSVRLWDADTGTEIQSFEGHTARVTSVAFSPDGTRLISGGEDGTTRLWDVATGALVRSMSSCTSTVSGVAFSLDGTRIAAGVAAENSIQLERSDNANGNDLNLDVPVPLSLANVASNRQYFLWAEIDTDRTDPVRIYSHVLVNVVPPFSKVIEDETPTIPYDETGSASVVVAPTTDRQIFSLGELKQGDRLHLALLSTPGYGELFQPNSRYSVLILDDSVDANDPGTLQPQMFAWYKDGFVLFDRNTNAVIGHDANYYMVIDGVSGTFSDDNGQSVSIRREEGFGYAPRRQQVYLNFKGANGVSVTDDPLIDIPAFSAADVSASFTTSDTAVIKDAIIAKIREMYVNKDGAALDIEFISSDDAESPGPNAKTVYFGGSSLFADGSADYLDPRNDTQTGSAIVFTQGFGDAYPGTPAFVGEEIGAVAAHEIGHLLGLRHVDNDADIMDKDAPIATMPSATFAISPISATEEYNDQIGFQNGPAYLEEIIGLAP